VRGLSGIDIESESETRKVAVEMPWTPEEDERLEKMRES